MTINASIGLTHTQEETLDRQMSAGRESHNGMVMNALQTGLMETFQGCVLENTIDEPGGGADIYPHYTRTRALITTDSVILKGPSQYFKLSTNDTTGGTVGFIDASAAGDTGILRMICNDTNTTAVGCVLSQGNALWIAPASSFKMAWDIAAHTCLASSGVAYTDNTANFGVAGTCVDADQSILNEFAAGATGGAYSSQFISVRFALGFMYLRVKCNSTSGGTVLQSEAIPIPTAPFKIKVEYNHSGLGGVSSLFINDQRKTQIVGTVTGPFQILATVKQAVAYVAATHTPAQLDIDTLMLSITN